MPRFFKGKSKKAEMPEFKNQDGVLEGLKFEHAENLMTGFQTIFFDHEGNPLDINKPGTQVYNLRGDPVSPYGASLIFDKEGNEIVEYDAYFNDEGDLINQHFKGEIYDEHGHLVADSFENVEMWDSDVDIDGYGGGYMDYYTPSKPTTPKKSEPRKYGGIYGQPDSYYSTFGSSYNPSSVSLSSSVFSKFGNYGYGYYRKKRK